MTPVFFAFAALSIIQVLPTISAAPILDVGSTPAPLPNSEQSSVDGAASFITTAYSTTLGSHAVSAPTTLANRHMQAIESVTKTEPSQATQPLQSAPLLQPTAPPQPTAPLRSSAPNDSTGSLQSAVPLRSTDETRPTAPLQSTERPQSTRLLHSTTFLPPTALRQRTSYSFKPTSTVYTSSPTSIFIRPTAAITPTPKPDGTNDQLTRSKNPSQVDASAKDTPTSSAADAKSNKSPPMPSLLPDFGSDQNSSSSPHDSFDDAVGGRIADSADNKVYFDEKIMGNRSKWDPICALTRICLS